jgi:hypothetical protein
MRCWKPALVLFVLAPLVGEVLFGAIPLSRLPFGLLGVVGLYGGGALLVREFVRRRRLPTEWMLWLGLAYGILEEGTVLQSLFDQRYPGLDFLGFYGHWAGVNWVWSAFIVPYHAVFSIAIPIALTELAFPDVREEPWLDRTGLIGAAAGLLVNGALLAVFKTGVFTTHAPRTSLWANLAAALCSVTVVAAAWRAQPAREGRYDAGARRPSPRRMRVIGVAAGLAWFVGLRVLIIGDGKNLPAWFALLAAALSRAAAWWRVSHWAAAGGWTERHTCALVAGALPTSWLLGFLVAAAGGGSLVVDLAGHVLFGVAMFVGLRVLRRQVQHRTPSLEPPMAVS